MPLRYEFPVLFSWDGNRQLDLSKLAGWKIYGGLTLDGDFPEFGSLR